MRIKDEEAEERKIPLLPNFLRMRAKTNISFSKIGKNPRRKR